MRTALPALLILTAIPAAPAAILLVSGGQSIQSAINQAKNGDTIEVGAGTYKERISFNGKEIQLTSSAGPGKTIIDGGGGGTTVEIGGKATIAGFTITGGAASFGGGMAVSGTGTRILNNIFSGNVQGGGGFGAAIAGNNASPLIAGNLFTANSSDDQHLSGTVSFVNGSIPVIQNNVFYDNQGRGLNLTITTNNGEGTTAGIVITNNTFVANTAAMRLSTSDLTIQNNIIARNDTGLEAGFSFLGVSFAAWTNNLLFGNGLDYDGIGSQTGSGGNFVTDPWFTNAAAGDFTLRAGSPAIDAGTALKSPPDDFAGKARPADGNGDGIPRPDIGAFEFTPVPEPAGLAALAGLLILFPLITGRSAARRTR